MKRPSRMTTDRKEGEREQKADGGAAFGGSMPRKAEE